MVRICELIIRKISGGIETVAQEVQNDYDDMITCANMLDLCVSKEAIGTWCERDRRIVAVPNHNVSSYVCHVIEVESVDW